MFADFCEKVLEEREKGRGKDARKKAKRAKNIRRKFSKIYKNEIFSYISLILLSRCPNRQTIKQTIVSVRFIFAM